MNVALANIDEERLKHDVQSFKASGGFDIKRGFNSSSSWFSQSRT